MLLFTRHVTHPESEVSNTQLRVVQPIRCAVTVPFKREDD